MTTARGTTSAWAEATRLIRRLGVPAKNLGYTYLRDAVVIVAGNRRYLRGITKELYPQVAALHGTNWRLVERAIRHAAEGIWTEEHAQATKDLLGVAWTERPTNKELITVLVDEVARALELDAAS